MGAICVETHFKGRQQAVTELFFHLCIEEGFRQADVREVGLGRVSVEHGGPIVVDDEPLEANEDDDVILVTPRDRSGWCVAYPSSHRLGERLVDMLGRPCPIEEPGRLWEERLDIEAAVHGFVGDADHGWGWLLRRDGDRTGFSHTGSSEAALGKDIGTAFAAVGRLFGEVGLDTVLHRLLHVARPPDLDAHKLCWASRSRASTA